jgi:hypothetical protein
MLCRVAWDHHRWMLWVYVPITLVTWVATIVFGWHYLADGLVSVVLVPLCYAAAGRIIGVEPAARASEEPRAAASA